MFDWFVNSGCLHLVIDYRSTANNHGLEDGMKQLIKLLIIATLFVATTGVLLAQDENPANGTIRGAVFSDANGDGICVNTGVEGEAGLADISLTFVNSDGEITMNHATGADGTFGLVAVGQSHWQVTVQAPEGWEVSGAETLFALIDDNNTLAENINFCLQNTGASSTQASGGTLLPEAGGSSSAGLTAVFAAAGLLLIVVGLVLEGRRRRQA